MNLIALGVVALLVAAKPYTINDLTALEKTGAWAEIIAHLDDIPPAKRDAEWTRIQESAAVEYTAGLAKEREAYAAYSAVVDLGRRYPNLMKVPAFTAKRAEVGLGTFASCFQQSWSGGECVDLLIGFVDADSKNEELAIKAAKLVRRNQNAYGAVPFFQRAVAASPSSSGPAKVCLDEDLKLAVIAGLGLPPDYENAKLSKKLAFESCWSALSDAVAEEFHKESKGSYYFTNTCDALKAKKMLSNLQAKQCERKD